MCKLNCLLHSLHPNAILPSLIQISIFSKCLINSQPHGTMCAKCRVKHKCVFFSTILFNIFKMPLWLILLKHSPGSSDGKLSYIYSVAYKPFGERSWIYLCPTALQRIQFFASLLYLECLQRYSVWEEKNLTMNWHKDTIECQHISAT